MCEEAERPESIVERDHDRALLRQSGAVVALLTAKAREEAAAMDPDHDRSPRTRGAGFRRPHVEIEAVLRDTGRKRVDVVPDVDLHAVMAQRGGRSDSAPVRGRLRGPPAERA